MKKFCIITLFLICILFGEEMSVISSPPSYSFSFSTFGSLGINLVSTPGRQNSLNLGKIPSFLVSFNKAIDSSVFLGIQTGFVSQSFSVKLDNLATEFLSNGNSFDFTINYIPFDLVSIFNNFSFGFGFLYPISGKYQEKIPKENLSLIFDVHLGYTICVYVDSVNSIFIGSQIRYPLKSIYKNFPFNDPLIVFETSLQKQNISGKHNPSIFWLGLGLVYRFSW